MTNSLALGLYLACAITLAFQAEASCASLWGQCGGANWHGATCCDGGRCTVQKDARGQPNPFYSQCLPDETASPPSPPPPSTPPSRSCLAPPDPLPVPPGAEGPSGDFTRVRVDRIVPGGALYNISGGGYAAMFAVTHTGVVLFDAPPSLSNISALIASVAPGKPITHLVYSHSHFDHIGGAALVEGDPIIIANVRTKEFLASRKVAHPPLPDVTFDRAYSLRVGGFRAELLLLPAGHDPGNTLIYAPAEKVVMLVDVVFPGWTPFQALSDSTDVQAYVDAHFKLLEYDFDVLIAGHLTRSGTKSDVHVAIAFLRDLVAAVDVANAAFTFGQAAAEVGTSNIWLTVAVQRDAVINLCYDALIGTWGGVLGGVDVLLPTHCAAVLQFVGVAGDVVFPRPVHRR